MRKAEAAETEAVETEPTVEERLSELQIETMDYPIDGHHLDNAVSLHDRVHSLEKVCLKLCALFTQLQDERSKKSK